MSKLSARNGASSTPGQDDDICPVCKSSRYLNPNMRFLVNPECYHKMCESCVDRIFSQGPAPCPVAGCARTLRKQRFRKQTFEDLQIEREVDIRRRVAAIFNRREEEFQTLRDYNNYLEDVENLTFNLLHNIDLPATEAKLASYASQNAATIAHNVTLSSQETLSAESTFAAQKEQAQRSREEARREEDAEKRDREEGRRHILNRLASERGGDAERIVREGQRVVLKKSTARRMAGPSKPLHHPSGGSTPVATTTAEADAAGLATSITPPAPLFEIQGLKPVFVPEPEKAYEPFGGYELRHQYFEFRGKGYEHPWLERAKTEQGITTGGYDVGEYCARAMVEAFAGLGVFVGEEVGGGEGTGDVGVGTIATAASASAVLGGGEE